MEADASAGQSGMPVNVTQDGGSDKEDVVGRNPWRRACVLALVGLPGAGKTTLAAALGDHLRSGRDAAVVHVCYDDIVSRERQAEMARSRRDGEESRRVSCA